MGEHLALDLSVELSCALLNVELVWCSTSGWTHHQVTSLVLEALYLSRIVAELEVPGFLLFLALLVGRKSGEQCLALLNLLVCVGMDDTSKVLHQTEVSSHSVCQASKLA